MESLQHNILAVVVHGSDNNSNKLVELYLATVVVVECLEETVNVLGVDIDTEVMNALAELVLVEEAILVGI